ncbi:MAG: sugar transferase [Puia sp.]|nr:sugar transferase [Puia sp.]
MAAFMNFAASPGSHSVDRGVDCVEFQSFDTRTGKNNRYAGSGFFYIGNESASIGKMVSAFKNGYASPCPQDARQELLRCLQREKEAVPEVIFCEGNLDFVAIRNLYRFVSRHPVLGSVPFVLNADGLSAKELAYRRRNRVSDEMVFLAKHSPESLLSKTRFYRRVKTRNSEMSLPKKASMLSFGSFDFHPGLLLKRIFDIIVASLCLLVLSPLFLVISLAIRIDSKGPVFYVSKRAGKGFRIFNFYKFRTMRTGADAEIAVISHLNQYDVDNSGPVFVKIKNDPRVTKIGKFLRNSSLDELPQILNVLFGHMSFVGNRPLPLYEATTLTTDHWAKRFMAPAGITGLWQIKKRGKEDMSVEERINLDIDYADKGNLMYDLWIIANTPSALLQKTSV